MHVGQTQPCLPLNETGRGYIPTLLLSVGLYLFGIRVWTTPFFSEDNTFRKSGLDSLTIGSTAIRSLLWTSSSVRNLLKLHLMTGSLSSLSVCITAKER